MKNILDKTLEMLDGEVWEETRDTTTLVKKIHLLRKKPLKDFTIEDLRICIGQRFFLQYLIPLAIIELEQNEFAEGDYYKGDLLKALIEIDDYYWFKHSGQRMKMKTIVNNALDKANILDDSDKEFMIDILKKGKVIFESMS